MFFLHILILYHLLEEVIFTLYYLYTTTNLQEVSVALGRHIPATLNLEQQSYFALGYYQMGAKLNKERKKAAAASKERTAAAEQ